MKLLAAGLAALALCAFAVAANAQDKRPNILIVVADDLGYSDIGVMGGEIPTPHLDALAKDGQLLTHMYGTSLPISRSTLLTGADHHLVGYGSMGPPSGNQIGKPGYERHLNFRALTIAQLLKDAGYHTYMTGTWGLGLELPNGPQAFGFDSSFAIIEAAVDYYAAEPQRLHPMETPTFRQDGNEVPSPEAYTTDVFTDKMIGFIDAHMGDGKPFFAYASYTSPHFPLQAPDADIARNEGRYDAGYDAVRLARIARQKASGVVPAGMKPADPVPESAGYKNWESLTAEERRIEARRMEVYAAMVENLDRNVGRLIAHLRASGQYDNTFILFTSGNGAAGFWPARRKPENLDNSLANMGRRHSWFSYTERWAEVSNAPFARWKDTMFEGGISVPGIVRLPGHNSAGSIIRSVVTFEDVAPTLLALANLPVPGSTYRDRAVVEMSGRSLLPVLEGKAQSVREASHVFADEHGIEGYVRQGDWKAVRLSTGVPGTPEMDTYLAAVIRGDLVVASRLQAQFPRTWHLYNIVQDRGETVNLAASELGRLKRLQALYEVYRKRVGVVDP